MSQIYTRTGDQGTTSLADGSRVHKASPRVMAYGEIDEANSWVGCARAFAPDPRLNEILAFLQHRLYNCSSNLATPPTSGREPATVSAEDVAVLERAIDVLEEKTGPLKGFVLPGGTRAAGLLHVARTVCRRAERRVWALLRTEAVDETVVKLLNRSSDLLFAAARYANTAEADGDILWDKAFPRPGW